MNSLIDTNVLSEFRRPQPNVGVIEFLRGAAFRQCYLSVITIAELRYGVDRMAPGKRRRELDHWLGWEIPMDFEDRLLHVTSTVADVAGEIRARAEGVGRPIGIMDAFIAATAQVNDLTLVTRNTRDFEVWGGPLFDPWTTTG